MANDLTFLMKLQNEMSAELKRVQADMKALDGDTTKVAGAMKKAGDDSRDAGAKIEKAGKDAERAGGFFSGAAKHLGDMAKIAGGFVIGQGLLQLPGLAKSFIDMASDMNESASKVATVFGPEQAKGMDAWAEAMAKMGTSKGDALAAVGTFGNFFATIGVNKDEAATMSQSLVQLASDFASFHNASPVEVMEAMGAALRGEAEPMSRFGILMNDATLKAQALKMGLIATEKDALSPQTKALAANALMFQQAGAAYGDFNRTSDGLANRQRILSAEFENVKASLGEKLLPVALQAAEGFMAALPSIEGFFGAIGNGIDKATPYISAFIDKAGPMLKQAFADVAPVVAQVGSAIQGGIQMALPYIERFGSMAQEQFGRFRAYIDSDLKPAFENIKQGIAAVIDYVVSKWPLIEPVVSAVVTLVVGHLKTLWDIISGIVKIVVDLIGGDWDGAWENVKQLARDMVDNVIATVKNLGALIEAVVPLIKSVLEDLGKKMLEGVKKGLDHWDEVANAIWEGVQKLPGLMGNVTDWLVDVGWDLLRGIAKGIRDGASSL